MYIVPQSKLYIYPPKRSSTTQVRMFNTSNGARRYDTALMSPMAVEAVGKAAVSNHHYHLIRLECDAGQETFTLIL